MKFTDFIKTRLLILAHKCMTSRKFIGAVVLTVFVSVAAWVGKCPWETARTWVEWIWGTWVAAQGLTDAAEKFNNNSNLPPKGQP